VSLPGRLALLAYPCVRCPPGLCRRLVRRHRPGLLGLLRTRVEISRERQNQQLLTSMDRRARLQLRLQQAVEGLSVAAISYCEPV